jgi:hypothetical protein
MSIARILARFLAKLPKKILETFDCLSAGELSKVHGFSRHEP